MTMMRKNNVVTSITPKHMRVDFNRRKIAVAEWIRTQFVGQKAPCVNTVVKEIKAQRLEGCFFGGKWYVYLDQPVCEDPEQDLEPTGHAATDFLLGKMQS